MDSSINSQGNHPASAALSSYQMAENQDGMTLGELIGLLLDGKRLIIGCFLGMLLLGGLYTFLATPIFQVKAMLQVEPKKSRAGNAALANLTEGFFEMTTEAQAEVEILKSDLVLGRTVEALHLDVLATPKFLPVIGRALNRLKKEPSKIEVDSFETADRGEKFQLECTEGDQFLFKGPEGEFIGKGTLGETFKTSWKGQALTLKVRSVQGANRQFFIQKDFLTDALENVGQNLTVAEKGKQTNIIGLTYEHPNAAQGAEILNNLLEQYVRQNIERKAEEASKTLAFLKEQLPMLKGKVEVAEAKLNGRRAVTGAVDLGEETKVILKQSSELETQSMMLNLKKDEMLRFSKLNSDAVQTLDTQLKRIQSESKKLDVNLKRLPLKQQEVIRLMRDVEVHQGLLASMMNNIQQLEMAKAGEIGNARVVDHAMPRQEPVKPKKPLVLSLSGLLGLLLGTGLIMMRKALNRGVEDPQLLEALGLPVLVTIPHSLEQEKLQHKIAKGAGEGVLLATSCSEDLAVESLRSLRTSLQFLMHQNRVVMLAGPAPNIGKSFVIANLAAVLAQSGAKVLLIDADLRKGKLHQYFKGIQREKGLSEILTGRIPWEKALKNAQNLDIITTGFLPPNPAELLLNARLGALIKEASDTFDYVLIDVPPILAVTDATIVGAHVDAVLITLKAGEHPVEEIRTALQRLESSGIRAKGFVFNDVRAPGSKYGYYRYAYHYSYQR